MVWIRSGNEGIKIDPGLKGDVIKTLQKQGKMEELFVLLSLTNPLQEINNNHLKGG